MGTACECPVLFRIVSLTASDTDGGIYMFILFAGVAGSGGSRNGHDVLFDGLFDVWLCGLWLVADLADRTYNLYYTADPGEQRV